MQIQENRTAKPKLPPVRVVKAVNKIRGGFSRLQQKMAPPHVALLELVTGQWVAQSVGVAARLGVADHVPAGGAAAAALAKKVKAQPEALYRLLRALCTVGLFREDAEGKFFLTAIGQCLREDHPQSMRAMSILQSDINWANWGALEHAVRTGECAAEKVFGMKAFEYFAKHEDKAHVFDTAMTNISRMECDAILAAYDFSGFATIADVGGGYGTLLSEILARTPKQRGILFDLPHVAAGARPRLKGPVGKRITIESGSFFERAPAGADAYLMKHILHDWSDDECRTILGHIRRQIPETGKLLLAEAVIPARNEPHFSKFLDLEMLVVTTGKERTEREWRGLLAGAGFRLDRVVPTVSMACVLEASPS